MKGNYTVYDQLYAQIRAAGEPGWGGRERLAKEGLWLERLLGQSQVPECGKVLELGCGEGHFTRLLCQKGYQVTGADVSAQAIEWAEAKALSTGLQIDYFVADLTQAGVLENQRYDLIVDGNCLHCIIGQDRSVFLANVFQALRPGGVFFVSALSAQGTETELIYRQAQAYRQISPKAILENELLSAGFVLLASQEYPAERHNHSTVHAFKPGGKNCE